MTTLAPSAASVYKMRVATSAQQLAQATCTMHQTKGCTAATHRPPARRTTAHCRCTRTLSPTFSVEHSTPVKLISTRSHLPGAASTPLCSVVCAFADAHSAHLAPACISGTRNMSMAELAHGHQSGVVLTPLREKVCCQQKTTAKEHKPDAYTYTRLPSVRCNQSSAPFRAACVKQLFVSTVATRLGTQREKQPLHSTRDTCHSTRDTHTFTHG
jgi:hypothetical protein